jgi:hypothetical protein
MQPYFLPYLGYFSLIKHTDLWVVFDTAQFIRHGWIERNRILKPGDGWQYIKVPLVKHARETPIKDVLIRDDEPWRTRILAQIDHYKASAPYSRDVREFLKDGLAFSANTISALNVHLLTRACEYLGVPFRYLLYSQSSLCVGAVTAPDEWALEITKALGAQEYINPPGGMSLFDNAKYERAGIKLSYLRPRLTPYKQRGEKFESGLSIIDAMMFNEPSTIRDMLDDVEFIPGGAANSFDVGGEEPYSGRGLPTQSES